jgi:REP element-mobilizing transposase RayT
MFLATLAEACAKTGWRVHAWTLMGNHYHWLLETPEANLVDGMKWFQNTYTRRFNTRHRAWGHLFGGRYKSVLVEGDGEPGADYLGSLMDYIHLNAVRAGLVQPGKGMGLLDFPWSSLAQGYGQAAARRPSWLETQRGFALFGETDTASGRRKFVERLERRARDEKAEVCGAGAIEGQSLQSTLRRGWYWGSQHFREKLATLLERRTRSNRNYRSSPSGRAHDLAVAERILEEGLDAAGLEKSDLPHLKGSDPRKVAIARAIHANVTVPQAWTAEQLHMRSAANVSQQIRRTRKLPRRDGY